MSTIDTPNGPSSPPTRRRATRTITAGGVTYAYRELGPKGGIPVVFFVHLAATLDNWDPRIIDPIAKNRHVITFDNRGVGASTGQVPDSIEAMADDAYTFIKALGFDKIDIFSFSMGGMIAQDLVLKHPDLVRKLVLTGTGPRGGKDMDKVVRHHLLGHPPRDPDRGRTRRSSCSSTATPTGKPAAKAFIKRLQERTVDRDKPISTKAFQTQLKAIQKFGRSAPVGPVAAHPPHPHRQRRQRPHGALDPLRGPAPPHQGIRADHLPRLRPRRHLPVPRPSSPPSPSNSSPADQHVTRHDPAPTEQKDLALPAREYGRAEPLARGDSLACGVKASPTAPPGEPFGSSEVLPGGAVGAVLDPLDPPVPSALLAIVGRGVL